MSSSLVALPQELLENVTCSLPIAAKAALSQTYRELHCRTIETIYRSITLTWPDRVSRLPPLVNGDEQPTNSPRIDCLLRTILENPQYTEKVTCIHFQSSPLRHGIQPWIDTKIRVPPLKSVVDLALDALVQANLQTTEWITAVRDNVLGATIALVLWHCPNLTEIRLGQALISGNPYLPQVLWDKLEPPHITPACRWHKLSILEIRDMCDREDTPQYRIYRARSYAHAADWRFTLPFLWSPALTSLTMSLGSSFSRIYKDMSQPTICSSLTTLRLIKSSASPGTLGELLACTPALTSLDYESLMESGVPFICDDMRDALAHVKDTLQHFRWAFHETQFGRVSTIVGRCDIKRLTSLTTLCISPRILLGLHGAQPIGLNAALPLTLKELCLLSFEDHSSSSEWSVDEIIRVARDFLEAEAWRQSTHNLERFYINNVLDGSWLEWEFWDKLEDLCEQNGLVYAPQEVWCS